VGIGSLLLGALQLVLQIAALTGGNGGSGSVGGSAGRSLLSVLLIGAGIWIVVSVPFPFPTPG